MEMVKKELMAFLKEEDGVGVIEIVLILVVLIGLEKADYNPVEQCIQGN